MAGIRWRVSRKRLILFTDWVARPLHSPDHPSDARHARRLVLHTAAYWLMLTVRDAIPKAHPLASAEFTTLRIALAQDRRAHRGDRDARAHRFRRSLPRSGVVP